MFFKRISTFVKARDEGGSHKGVEDSEDRQSWRGADSGGGSQGRGADEDSKKDEQRLTKTSKISIIHKSNEIKAQTKFEIERVQDCHYYDVRRHNAHLVDIKGIAVETKLKIFSKSECHQLQEVKISIHNSFFFI